MDMHHASIEDPIKKIIFFDETNRSDKVLGVLGAFADEYEIQLEYAFTANLDTLFDEIEPSSLVVAASNYFDELRPRLFLKGVARLYERSEFLMYFQHLLLLNKAVYRGGVILGFLPLQLENLLKSIFTFYGYSVNIVHSYSGLQRVLKSNAFYLIMNQDLSVTNLRENKSKMLDLIRARKLNSKDFAVSIVKDFDQGSLFDDIASNVREFCNLMLSPGEFVIFVINYLNYFFQQRIMKEQGAFFSHLHAYQNNALDVAPGLGFNQLLRDANACYKCAMDQRKQESLIQWQKPLSNNTKNLVRHRALAWLIDYIGDGEDLKSRASFEFAKGKPNEADAEPSSIEKPEPKKVKKVLPQEMSDTPNLPFNFAEGPM